MLLNLVTKMKFYTFIAQKAHFTITDFNGTWCGVDGGGGGGGGGGSGGGDGGYGRIIIGKLQIPVLYQ